MLHDVYIPTPTAVSPTHTIYGRAVVQLVNSLRMWKDCFVIIVANASAKEEGTHASLRRVYMLHDL